MSGTIVEYQANPEPFVLIIAFHCLQTTAYLACNELNLIETLMVSCFEWLSCASLY